MTNSGPKPSIVFFGTGPVAAESLKLLLEWFAVEAVITKSKPAHHRGAMPVEDVAREHTLPLVFAENKKTLSQAIASSTFKSQVGVLIDFGIIVEQDVIDAFPLGIINSHFSLLPQWRGADPISFAILSGQKNTGVSLMHLVEAMDEGPILGVGIEENIDTLTTPELTAKLILLSASLLRDLLPKYISGELQRGHDQASLYRLIPDYPAAPTYSRKLSKSDGVLDFSKPAKQLEREIRAFAEWPKSRTTIAGKDVVITKAHVQNHDIPTDTKHVNGDVFAHQQSIYIQTAEGYLVVDELKPSGKQTMTARAFLAGYGKLLRN